MSAVWNSSSAKGAVKVASDACVRGNGEGRRVVSGQAIKRCGAVAADGAGLVYLVTDRVCFGIEKKTIDWCRSQSKAGSCHLLTGSVVAGSGWHNNGESATVLNCAQMSLSDDQLTALSK
jgi:hypothetical protein